MFERFTDRARQVLVLAQDEARLLDHNFIGTEHLLLGLLHEGGGVAGKALDSLGVTLETARAKVAEAVGPTAAVPPQAPPFTPRSKKVLELSLREALQFGHKYIGTEHLLLGLVREGEGVGAKVLETYGATPDRVREQVIQLLSDRFTSGTQHAKGSFFSRRRETASRIVPDPRVELLEGEIVERAPTGSRHDASVDRLAALLQPQLAGRAILRVQGSIRLADRSEPRPDIAILRWKEDFYAEELPGPADVLLVVEVAESSADTDREKAMIYARAGIRQMWVIDLPAGQIVEFSDPNPGGYAYSHTQLRGDNLRVAALSQVEIDVGDVLV